MSKRFLPPEWYPQSAVILTWPHGGMHWDPIWNQIQSTFVALAAAIAPTTHVLINCQDDEAGREVHQLLVAQRVPETQFTILLIPSNDIWARDHGPITLLSQEKHMPRILDFEFNAWGQKYPFELDDLVPLRLKQKGAFGLTPLERVDLVLEGGSIEVDGHGTLMTTEHCLLCPNRNPHLTQAKIVERLKHALGVQHVLWLKHGQLAGDDTDGHIDTLARFCDEQSICYVTCDDSEDEHYADLKAMEAELQAFRDVAGKPYRLVPLPWPKAKYSQLDCRRLPATYANFLITNDRVIMPTYRDPADEKALAVLQTCFPDHTIVPVDAIAVIENYGSLHCVTMQVPAGIVARQGV